jgi:hypothetical protein
VVACQGNGIVRGSTDRSGIVDFSFERFSPRRINAKLCGHFLSL